MNGNILDTMARDKKKAFNQAQQNVASPTVQANNAVKNAYNPNKVQNTVQKITAPKINNIGNNGMNNNAVNKNIEEQRSTNVERQLNELEAFNRDMRKNNTLNGQTAFKPTQNADNQWQQQFDYNRKQYNTVNNGVNNQLNNAIRENKQIYNNINPVNSSISEEERQLSELEALNNEQRKNVSYNRVLGNMASNNNAPEGYDPNVDYSAEIEFAINSGAPWQEVEKLYQMRDYKKSTNPEKYGQYNNDKYDLNAKTYINENSMIDRLYDGDTDTYNQSVDLGLQNKINALNQQKEQAKTQYDDIRSQAYNNARLSAIGNNEKMASIGLAGGLYSSPVSGYSETSRMAQDNALRGNISSADRQEQERLEELQNLENEERNNAEAEKLSYLASMGDKKAQATLEKYYSDRNYNYQKQRDEVSDNQWQQQFDYNKGVDERNFKYQVGRDNVADSQWEREYELSSSAQKADMDFKNKQLDFERYKYDKDYRLQMDTLAFEKNMSLKEFNLKQQAQNQSNALSWADYNLSREKFNFDKQQSGSEDLFANWSKERVINNKAQIVEDFGEDYYNALLASKY